MFVFKRGIRYIRRVKPARSQPNDVLSQIKRLHEIENDPSSSYVDKSASAIKEYMHLLGDDTSDPQFWRSVKMFESASPSSALVKPLLPQLWEAADRSAKFAQQEYLRIVGDLAFSTGLLGTDKWTLKYMNALSHKNPYRAIEIWSKNKSQYGTSMGIIFYCRAGLPKKAETLVNYPELSPLVCREFILAYCKQHNTTKVEEWIKHFKSMSEKDQRWIWHVLRLYNMDNAVAKSLPKPTWQVPAPSKPKLGQRDYNLIGEVSKLVCIHPQILEDDEMYKAWAKFVVNPRSYDLLLPVLDALIHQDPFTNLASVLKCISKAHITDFVLRMDRDEAYPTPGLWEWAQAIQHAVTPEQAAIICEKMRLYSYLFTTQGFSAVCNSKVPNLARLAEEARHRIPLTEHMLICVWRSLSSEPPEWLWAQSSLHEPSFRLLKNIVAHCLDTGNIVGVARALYDFMVVNNAALDDAFVDWMVRYAQGKPKEAKFSSPKNNTGGTEAWSNVCQLICQHTNTMADWVCSHVSKNI